MGLLSNDGGGGPFCNSLLYLATATAASTAVAKLARNLARGFARYGLITLLGFESL